jgi:acetyl-CoA carboxylase, biotin carboxylase subunit
MTSATRVGYPVMVKAVMGGGGIGMGVARDEDDLRAAVETVSSRGARFFADASVFLERYVEHGRHVEIQILADDRRTMDLYERECSVQRRHQKVIEETPSPALDPDLRDRMCGAAVRSMAAIGYRGAGTVECILTPDREFFLLEVNARLQVEHPLTEVTTGVDLVEEQLRIAGGVGMSLGERPSRYGHAIELRVYAEDPRTLLPAPGRISRLVLPGDGHARCDFGYDEGDEVPMFYDPLIGKVILHGDRRENLPTEILDHVQIEGPKTNLPLLRATLRDERFRSGEYDTGLLGR